MVLSAVTSPYRFYLGPVGFLKWLPPLPRGGDVKVGVDLISAKQQTMGGTSFTHYFGEKRTWSLAWKNLSVGEYEALVAFQGGLAVKPLRLVDQRIRNRLSPEVASGGTLLRRVDPFVASSGALTWQPVVVPGLESILGGGINWVAPLNGTLGLKITERVPIQSDWGSYTLSCWAKGAGTARIQAIQQDSAGANPSTTNGSAVALTGTAQRLSVAATYVAGKALLDFVVQATVAGTMQITGWQVQAGSTLLDWVPGGGCPVVTVEDLQITYPMPRWFDASIKIRES